MWVGWSKNVQEGEKVRDAERQYQNQDAAPAIHDSDVVQGITYGHIVIWEPPYAMRVALEKKKKNVVYVMRWFMLV